MSTRSMITASHSLFYFSQVLHFCGPAIKMKDKVGNGDLHVLFDINDALMIASKKSHVDHNMNSRDGNSLLHLISKNLSDSKATYLLFEEHFALFHYKY